MISSKFWQTQNGVQRLIDNEGTIVNEHYNPDGGISIYTFKDKPEWLEKEGLLDEKNKNITAKKATYSKPLGQDHIGYGAQYFL